MLRTHFRCFWKISFSPRSLLLDYSYSRFCFISLLYHEKKEERKIFTILFSPIRIYIHTRYGKKTTRLPSPLPLRIIKPCICHRSEPVSVPRNRNRCLTHSTKESVSSSRGPKQSFSNPIFQPNRGIDSIRVVSRFTRFEKFVRNGFRLDSKNSFGTVFVSIRKIRSERFSSRFEKFVLETVARFHFPPETCQRVIYTASSILLLLLLRRPSRNSRPFAITSERIKSGKGT